MRQTLAASDDLPQDQDQQPSLVVRADSPAALLRLVPHLLGFMPEASLVVIGVAPPRDRIRVTLRYDLPDPPEPDLIADMAALVVGVLSAQRLTAAVAIGYGAEALVIPVADELRDAAWQAEIDLREFLRVQDGRYWSYRLSGASREAGCLESALQICLPTAQPGRGSARWTPVAGAPTRPSGHPAAIKERCDTLLRADTPHGTVVADPSNCRLAVAK